MKFFKELTKFQLGFFFFFSTASLIIFLLPLVLTNEGFKSVFSGLGMLGLFATFCGILVSIYTAKARPVAYIWWIGSTISMAIICLVSSLYGQFIQNLFFSLPIQIYGFFAWQKNVKKSSTLEIRKFTKKQWMLLAVLVILCWVGYGALLYFLPFILLHVAKIKIAEDPQLLLDSFTAMMAIVAAILTDLRFIEQWYFWIVYNSLAVVTFIIQITHSDVTNTSVLIANLSNTLNLTQYVIGVIYGYIIWVKLYKKANEKV